MVFTIALFSISHSDRNNVKYALLTHRSIAMALFVMAANMAGICAGQVLRTNDAPKYHNAFLALPVVSIFSLLVIACITVQNIWSNRKLEQKFPLANNQVSEENFTAETRKVEKR